MIKSRGGWNAAVKRTLTAAIAVCALLPPVMAQIDVKAKASHDLQKTLTTVSPHTVVRVILNFRDSMTISNALTSGKATLVRTHPMFGLCVVDIRAGDLTQLLNSNEIIHAVPNRAMRQFGKTSTASKTTSTRNSLAPGAAVTSAESHVRVTTAANQASADGGGLTGAGITVAVVDSGIYEHPDLMDPATGLSRVIAHLNYASDAAGNGDP